MYELIKKSLKDSIRDQIDVGILASSHRTKKDEYQIIFYSKNLWETFFLETLRLCMEEYWRNVYTYRKRFLFKLKEIEYGALYMYIYKTECIGETESGIKLCYYTEPLPM